MEVYSAVRPRSTPFLIGAVALSLGSLGLTPPVSAQTGVRESAKWTMPRTAFGHPDLQGNWTNATLTPFQRAEGQAPVFTPQQVSDLEAGRASYVDETAAQSDPNRPPPVAGGVDDPVCIETLCYNEVYTARGDRVAVVNGEARSSLITYPSDGRIPDLTREGRQHVEMQAASRAGFGPFDHPELRPLAERCIVSFGTSAGPPMLPNYWYNNNYTIVQNADHIMIMSEMVHDVRIIRLGEPTSPTSGLRPWFGESWGHWEGNTLVVETTDLNPEHTFRGVAPSADRTVTERFTRVDEETVLYEFTIDDPVMYSSSWGGQIPFKRFDDRLYEYACHEGNYSISNVLSGARYQEREARREEPH